MAPHLDIDWDSMSYRPIIFFNEFWHLHENLVPVNASLPELVIPLDLAQMGLWKFTIFQQVEKSFEMQVGRGSLSALPHGAGFVPAWWPLLAHAGVVACLARLPRGQLCLFRSAQHLHDRCSRPATHACMVLHARRIRAPTGHSLKRRPPSCPRSAPSARRARASRTS